MADALAEVNASETELHTFLRAAAMSAITILPPPKKVANPIEYCDRELIPWSIELLNEVFNYAKKRFKEKRLVHVLTLDHYI